MVNEAGGTFFRWKAISGKWAAKTGSGLPRNASPCGSVVDRDATMLFYRPERYYPYLREANPSVIEALLAPFRIGGAPVGTVWVAGHTESVKFESADVHVMQELAQSCHSAYDTLFGQRLL